MSSSSSFLRNSRLSQLIKLKQPLIYAEAGTSVARVCDALRLHRLLSMPVWDARQARFVGMANIADICARIVWGSCREGEAHPQQELQLPLVDLSIINEKPIESFLFSHEAKYFWVFQAQDAIESLLEPFSKGIHRLVRVHVDVPFNL